MLFLESLRVAIVAYVFFGVLTAPGMIFEWWYNILEKWANNGREWIAKPLGYCGTCFAGQLGFWWYLIAYRDAWILGEHIVFISQTILFFLIVKKGFEKW